MQKIANIIVDMHHASADRIFDYLVPEKWLDQVCIGQRVLVPFGQKNKKLEGYILGITNQSEIAPEKIKQISEILDDLQPAFTPELIQLAKWLKDHYFCTMSQALQAVMPPGIRTKSSWFAVLESVPEQLDDRESDLILFLQEHGGSAPLQELEDTFGNKTEAILRRLESKIAVRIVQKVAYHKYIRQKRYFTLNLSTQDVMERLQALEKKKGTEQQRKMLTFFLQNKTVSMEEIKKNQLSLSSLKTLLKNDILVEEKKQDFRFAADTSSIAPTSAFVPTAEQANALRAIREERKQQQERPILLRGITSSGKTEIYLQIIQDVLDEGKQAIILVPEISLTPQIFERFVSRFGNQVTMTHSRLSMGERLDQWKRAAAGEISVIIGPRSAMFVPFQNVGIIIVDEVQETSYYSDLTPKYDAREAALAYAKITGATIILGSATPPITMYHKARQGEYLLVELTERTKGSHLPEVILTDMRRELANGNHSVFSAGLEAAIRENLEKKQQIMLLLNRRGFSTFVSCRKCGHVMTCPQCDLSYTYHAKENALVCHYCGRSVPLPKVCPTCGSKYIKYFGTGTQKIEAEARRMFPQATILRMDLDTTSTKGSHEKILQAFKKGQADILIGTQMIAKGHDIPNVTLVGILAADLALYQNTYTAAENTFQIITQAAGRAGREQTPGRVYIQTYQPDHYAIRLAQTQDYAAFYEKEISLRKVLDYPPFSHFFSVVLTGDTEETLKLAGNDFAQLVQQKMEPSDSILGPSPVATGKFRGQFRYRLLLRSHQEEWLRKIIPETAEKIRNLYKNEIRISLLPDIQL